MKEWNSIDDVLKALKADKDDFEHVMLIGITKGAQLTVISGDATKPQNMVEVNIRAALFTAAFEKIKLRMLSDDSTATHSVH